MSKNYSQNIIDLKEVLKRLAVGQSVYKIAAEMGRPYQSIYRVLKKHRDQQRAAEEAEKAARGPEEKLLTPEERFAALNRLVRTGPASAAVSAIREMNKISGLYDKQKPRDRPHYALSKLPDAQLDSIGGIAAGIESGHLTFDGMQVRVNPAGPPLPEIPYVTPTYPAPGAAGPLAASKADTIDLPDLSEADRDLAEILSAEDDSEN